MKFYKASQWILVTTSCIYLLFCVVNLIISNEFVISLILALILVLNTGYTIVFFPKSRGVDPYTGRKGLPKFYWRYEGENIFIKIFFPVAMCITIVFAFFMWGGIAGIFLILLIYLAVNKCAIEVNKYYDNLSMQAVNDSEINITSNFENEDNKNKECPKKVYLLKGIFLSLFTAFSFIFIPFMIVLIVIMVVDFEIFIAVISGLWVAFYIMLGVIFYKYSLSPENYMILKESSIYFHYVKNKNYSVMDKEIDVKDILEIEYYKINSISGWFFSFCSLDIEINRACILLNTPDCLENATIEIGYFSTKQIKNIAEMYKIPLVVHGFLGKRKYNFE